MIIQFTYYLHLCDPIFPIALLKYDSIIEQLYQGTGEGKSSKLLYFKDLMKFKRRKKYTR